MKRLARGVVSSAPLWMAVGTANVILGVAIALRIDGSRDAGWLWIWTRNWLQGNNPYDWPIPADYPPWALVALSPIGMMSSAAVPAVWAGIGVALAIVAAWLGPKAMAMESPPVRLSIGVFLAWAAVRYGLGNGQFALLAAACGLAAVWLARRGSGWSGVLLGAALIKPHVGVAFLAWAVAAAKWRSICGALATVGAATVVFSARLDGSAMTTVAQYVRQIGVEFRGPNALRGTVEIRPLLDGVMADPRVAGIMNVSLIALGFAAIVWTLRGQSSETRERLALPLFCLWTLASAFHNAYDLVLLWPVWLALWDRHERDPEASPYLLAFVQAALVAGVPGIWWKMRGSGAGLHFDRVLVVGLLIYLIATRRAGASVPSRRPSLGEVHRRELIQAPPRHSSKVMLP
jgi:Glycosyltransferase family 87